MKAFELRRLEPYSRWTGQQLMDLAERCREITIAAGRHLEVRSESVRGQCFLLEGSVQVCAVSARRTRVLETVSHPSARARKPLFGVNVAAADGNDVLVRTRFKSRILIVDREVERSPGSVHVTPLGSTDENTWMRQFLGSAIAADLPPKELRNLFREFTSVDVKAGQVIGRKGDPPSCFHVIKSGQARILDQVTLAVLGPGEFFGEDSLIREAPRSATISMLSDGELLVIGERAFRNLVCKRFLRPLEPGRVAVHLNLVSQDSAERESAHLNVRIEGLRSALSLLDREIKYLLLGEPKDVELAAFILTHHGYQAFTEPGACAVGIRESENPISQPIVTHC